MELRKYGEETTLDFPMIKRDAVDFAVTGDWTPATGDTKISKDEGADANTTNNPAIVSGTKWKLVLTATEMQAARICITIVDQGTKAVEDQCLVIETYGHASAQHQTFPGDVKTWKGTAPDDLSSGKVQVADPAGVTETLTRIPDATAGGAGGLAIVGSAMTLTSTYDAAKTAAAAGAAMALTSGERTALAAALEAAIINELDGAAVMQAIADLIASDMTTTDLTVAAIAAACRDAILNRVLAGNHDTTGTAGKLLQNADVATSTRLADASYTAPPSASDNATAVASALETAHGSGPWTTATGFATSEQATAIKAVTDKLATTVVQDGEVYQFTPNALENAPAGTAGGGDATAANQETIIAAIGIVDGLVDAIAAVSTKVNTTMEADGDVYRYTQNALERAPSGTTAVTVLPLTSQVIDAGRVPYWILAAYQHCKWQATLAIFDKDNDAVDLGGKTLSLVAWATSDPTTAVFELRSDGTSPELTISGASNNQITISAADSRTETARTLKWRIYNTTDDIAVADGEVRIEAGPSAT
jgi:hypothetical protein